jgi:hypothetical protein
MITKSNTTYSLPKQKYASFTLWAMLILLALGLAGHEFGTWLMGLFFAN